MTLHRFIFGCAVQCPSPQTNPRTSVCTCPQACAILEADGGAPVTLLVADKPNPLGGLAVDGPMLNVTCCASG